MPMILAGEHAVAATRRRAVIPTNSYVLPGGGPPVAGYLLWFDASDTASITDAGAGAVSQWNDKSGNGLHLTQGTGANRPTTGTRTLNSKNVVDFDGTNDVLITADFTQAQPVTVFAVAAEDVTTAGAQQVVGNGNVTPTLFSQFSTTYRYFAGTLQSGSGLSVDTNPHIWVGVFNGVSSSLRIDGTPVSTGNPGANGWSTKPLRIGASFTPDSWFNGIVAEVIVYPSALSGGDLAAVEAYLDAKWTP